jgi:hypothetical protein
MSEPLVNGFALGKSECLSKGGEGIMVDVRFLFNPDVWDENRFDER